jgi:DivIVA domain-containing protein
MPLTPADVRNKQFSTTRLRPGYDEEEVDAFLDEIEAELDRLVRENEELRAKLAESLRGGQPAVPSFSASGSEQEPEMAAPMMLGAPPQVMSPEQQRRPEPMMADTQSTNMNSIARVLSLAQQTADQAVADARREAGETLGRARREASDILGKARHQAEQITNDARARSESLDRDAQERHRQALGSLIQQREELERRVGDLQIFEREYRSRLMAYLEGQLRDLEAGTADNGGFPPAVAAQRSARGYEAISQHESEIGSSLGVTGPIGPPADQLAEASGDPGDDPVAGESNLDFPQVRVAFSGDRLES